VGENPPLKNSRWKNVLDIVQTLWAPLGKLFAPPAVPSWLRACISVNIIVKNHYMLIAQSCKRASF